MPTRDAFATFDKSRDTVRLSWSRVAGATRYHVSVEVFYRFDNQQFIDQTYSAFADTSIAIAGTARTLENDEVFPAGTLAVIQVSAVDDNYYTYYHLKVDPFAGAPPSRLTGAVGVFGSVAAVHQRIYEDIR